MDNALASAGWPRADQNEIAAKYGGNVTKRPPCQRSGHTDPFGGPMEQCLADIATAARIADSHNQDRSHVIEDCQGQEKQAEARRDAGTEEREAPDDESRVGGHHGAPAMHPRLT
jgi:hypothetical protein